MIKCPNCGESHYEQRYSTRTAMYFPPIYKDGININEDRNTTTYYCSCCACHHNFRYSQCGEDISDIVDEGLVEEPPLITDSLTSSSSTPISNTITIKNLNVNASPSISDLQEAIKDLQAQIAALAAEVYALN